MKGQFPLALLCQTLAVSASGFYDWAHRQAHPTARAREDQALAPLVQQLFAASRQTFGSPRIQRQLQQQGRCHGRNRIARLMRQQGLCGRSPRRFKVCTTDSRHGRPVAPNRLLQAPPPTRPNQVWLGDITYIATGEGWLYLAGVEDLWSRRLVGWSLSERIDTPLVLAAWHMACTHRQPPPGLIFHSDQGAQYAGPQYAQALHEAQAQASMSRKGNCYDNAPMESFWSTLKLELVYRRHFKTRAEARLAIIDYLETFYNRRRLHSALNYMSPVDFENSSN